MNAAPRIAGHGLLAGAFFFCLQKFVLGESLEPSILWGVGGACGAALLAWVQHRRGGSI